MAVKQQSLSEPASFVLDVIRFSAAILVVAAHLGHPEFRTNLPNRQILGDIAVPFFFVLSGFVIRFVTLSREHTLREYLIDRASRIYSIALPAMALTLGVTALLITLTPAYYNSYFAGFASHPFARIALNLAFVAQSWSRVTIPFTNSPFWSLSYECPFYLAYGLAFYLRGWRRIVSLILWALIAGPQVIFLLPIWWLGCALYDGYRRLRGTRAAVILRLLSVSIVFLGGLMVAIGRRNLLLAAWYAIKSLTLRRNPLDMLGIDPRRATLAAFVTGVLAAVIMLMLLLLSDLVPADGANVWFRRFRHLANGTFAIYLMHYPLMALATGAGLLRPNHRTLNVLTTVAICVALIAIAPLLDRFKTVLRRGLRKVWVVPRISGSPPSTKPGESSGQAPGKRSSSALWSR